MEIEFTAEEISLLKPAIEKRLNHYETEHPQNRVVDKHKKFLNEILSWFNKPFVYIPDGLPRSCLIGIINEFLLGPIDIEIKDLKSEISAGHRGSFTNDEMKMVNEYNLIVSIFNKVRIRNKRYIKRDFIFVNTNQ